MEKYNVVFESNNIVFIKVNEKLINDYLKMVNNHDVQKGISHSFKEYTKESEIEWVKSKIENDATIFSMIEKDTGEYIGNIEIMNIVNGDGEIGIAITPSKQNRHYGQESINAIISYAMNTLKLKNINLNVHKDNSRAIRCYENVGFVADNVGKTADDIHMTYLQYELIPYSDDKYDFVYKLKKEEYKKNIEFNSELWEDDIQKKQFDSFINSVKNDTYIINANGVDIGFYNGQTLENGDYKLDNICIILSYQGKTIENRVLKDIIQQHNEQDLHIQFIK